MTEKPEPPIEPESPTRRKLFLLTLAGAGSVIGAGLCGAAGRVLLAPLSRTTGGTDGWTDLGAANAFDAVKSGSTGAREVVAVRTVLDGYLSHRARERVAIVKDGAAPAGLAALSTTCSHLGCGVAWNEERRLFLCPCHGGVYAPDGAVVSGPPPKPLTRLPLLIDGGRVRVNLDGAA